MNDNSWLAKELKKKSMGYDEWIRFHPVTGQLEQRYLDWNEVMYYVKDLYDKGWVCISGL